VRPLESHGELRRSHQAVDYYFLDLPEL
jgi:hypothetical protein